MWNPPRIFIVLATAAATLSGSSGLASGEPAKPSAMPTPAAALSNEELLRDLHCMEQRLRALENELKSRPGTPTPAEGPRPATETVKPFPMRWVRGEKPTKPSDEEEPKRPAGATESTPKPAAASGKPSDTPTPATDPCAPLPKTASPTPATTPATPPPGAAAPAAPQQLLPPLPGGPPTGSETPGKPGSKPILGITESPIPGLSIGAYGEIKYGAIQNPVANGQWQNGFDAHRLVLLPT